MADPVIAMSITPETRAVACFAGPRQPASPLGRAIFPEVVRALVRRHRLPDFN
jgi:hypothetical protein